MQSSPNTQSSTAAVSHNARRPSKLDALTPFHDRIVGWRQQGMDLRAIAAHLKAEGCAVQVDHNVVARYTAKHSIPTGRTSVLANDEGAKSPLASSTELEASKFLPESREIGPSLCDPTPLTGVVAHEKQPEKLELPMPAENPPTLLDRLDFGALANLRFVDFVDAGGKDSSDPQTFEEQE